MRTDMRTLNTVLWCLILMSEPVVAWSQAQPTVRGYQASQLTAPTSERQPRTRDGSPGARVPVLQPMPPIASQIRFQTQEISFKTFLQEVERVESRLLCPALHR